LIINRAKGLELMKIIFITDLNLKIMDFENIALTKVVHIYVIEGMNA
jgi:hypothetical protein